MVFKLDNKGVVVTELICGLIMLISATAVILRIHSGSKSQFAYILMSLNAVEGISYVGLAFTDAF